MNEERSDPSEILKNILTLLDKIDRTYAGQRAETISQLQNIIFDTPELEADELYFLQDLAGDLSFYESDERDRDLELGYYGDDKLLEVTEAARKQIQALPGQGNNS